MAETPGTTDTAGVNTVEKDKALQRLERQVKASGKKWNTQFKKIRRARQLLRGAIPDDLPLVESPVDSLQPSKKVRANLILASLEAMLPLIYARNPDVSVRPSEKVGSEGEIYNVVRAWSETLEIVVSHQLRTGGLKRQAKKAVKSVQAAKVGWLKVTYQREYGQDPQIANRMNDVQDNLQSIQARITDLSDQNQPTDELEGQAAELQQMVEGLSQTPEVALAEGVVVDHIATENMRMDPSVSTLEDYMQAGWIAHYTMKPVQEYRDEFGIDDDEGMRGVKIYVKGQNGQLDSKTWSEMVRTSDVEGDVCLWELWRRQDNTVYTWAEGAAQFAREPYVPQGLGERWYPFFLIGFHWIDGSEWPESSVELLERLQQEYNDTREQLNEHRKANVPHYIASASDVTPEDVKSFEVAGAREVVIIDASGRPLREIIAPSPSIPLNPAMYQTDDTRFDMQWVSGLQDAARGGIVKAKTLGEAEIAQSHLASRVGNFQDELEEMLTDMAVYVTQILLQKMHRRTVLQIAGDNAVWPELNRSDVFDLFNVEIRAGSTGKPDKTREQEQWAALLDNLMSLVERILMMRQSRASQDGAVVPGIPDDQNPYVAILEETLKRFDERIDLEQFLPPQQPPQQPTAMQGGNGAAGASGLPPEMSQAIQAAAQQQAPAATIPQ